MRLELVPGDPRNGDVLDNDLDLKPLVLCHSGPIDTKPGEDIEAFKPLMFALRLAPPCPNDWLLIMDWL